MEEVEDGRDDGGQLEDGKVICGGVVLWERVRLRMGMAKLMIIMIKMLKAVIAIVVRIK